MRSFPIVPGWTAWQRSGRRQKKKVFQFNHTSPEEQETLDRLIREIIGVHGEALTVEQPFHCDYGSNIEVGENFFANYNLTILDVAKVVIGSNVQIAPNVSIYTAGHPLDPEAGTPGMSTESGSQSETMCGSAEIR